MNKKFCLVVLLSIMLCTLYVVVTSWSLKIKKELTKSNSVSNNYKQNDITSLKLIFDFKASIMNSTSYPSICTRIHNEFNGEPKNSLKSSYNETIYHSKAISNNLDMIQGRRKLIMIALDVGYVNNTCLLKTVGLINIENIITYQNIYLHQIKNKLGRT